MRRLTQEEFEIKIRKIYGEKFSVIGNYINAHTNIELKCNTCGYVITNTPNKLDEGWATCPVCNAKRSQRGTIVGVNDMWTTDLNVASLLADSNDGYRYRINTKQKLLFICPICHNEKECLPSNVKKQGLSCIYCSDGISYPNKYIRNILKLSNISFIPEYKIQNHNYYFDVYFEYKNNKYVIEMDGGYGHGFKDSISMTKEESIRIDRIKDSICLANGINIIRIDCNYSDQSIRKECIKANILKSELGRLFSFSDEIFNQADVLSQKSNVLLFLELWNDGHKSYNYLKKELNVKTRTTIRTYAKQCIANGLLQITYEEFLREINKFNNYDNLPHRSQPIKCLETGQYYSSITEARKKLGIQHFDRYFNGQIQYGGQLEDGTKLNWGKVSKQEYLQSLSA